MKHEETTPQDQLMAELNALRQQLATLEERVVESATAEETTPSHEAVVAAVSAGTGQHQSILEAAPEAIIAVDGNGRIVLANEKTQTLFGYDQDELLGETVEQLIPVHFRDRHIEHRHNYSAEPRTRPMNERLDLVGRRKDGLEIPLRIGLSFIEQDDDLLAIAMITEAIESGQDDDYGESSSSNLISTKLQPPQLTSDYIPRPRLFRRFDRQRRLTLVSAPAGYGKSTLLSSWLEILDCPTAWLSLDENDNDMAVFLSYFIAAIQTEFPDIGGNTLTLLNSAQKPPLQTIATSLINELNFIEQAYVLVLDDYHLIQEKRVHDLLAKILLHSPRTLHLVLASRVDPPIPLASLRARSQVMEIRAQDLRFNETETAALVEKLLGTPIDQTKAASLEEQSEGWVTGLRLAVLSREHLGNHDPILNDIHVNNRFVTDYLMSSVYSLQRPDVQEWLIQTAILDRFSPQLCEAVCLPGDDVKAAELDGESFVDLVSRANLFVIPLDQNHQWFRYHHLFQRFLQSELRKRHSPVEIDALHSRASGWFAKKGFVDEALHHALTSGDFSAAGQIIVQYRHSPLNEDKWYVLDKWLSQLPDETVQQRPALLLAKAWVANYKSAFWAIPPILEAVESLLEKNTADESLWGEVDFFRGILLCWEGHGESSMELLSGALERIPITNLGARNEVEIYFAVASQIAGRGKKVVQTYEQMLFDERTVSTRKMRLLSSIVFIHLLSGDLAKAEQMARWLADMASSTRNVYVGSWASYMLGYCHYGWNNLETAIQHFKDAVEQKYALDNNAPVDVYAGLIFSYQALRQPDNANETLNSLLDFVRQADNPDFTNLALSVQARLALLQGNYESAVRWLKTADLSFDVGTTLFWVDVPRLNHCRVLIALGSESSLREATVKLKEHWHFSQVTHNVPVMISVLLLQTLAYKKLGQAHKAIEALDQAVSVARPSGWIQPFVEVGSEVVSLLRQLSTQSIAPEYIAQILSAYPEIAKPGTEVSESYLQVPSMQTELLEQLTYREREVLALLANELSNQEIASSLTISPNTVKRHTANIYRKLDVKNRRQAVTKAESLGILRSA